METSELLKKVRRIEIKTRGLSNNIFAGEYHTAFKGKGMTFSEVREYQYGDEIRTIDWNVTARFRKPFVKVFEEERAWGYGAGSGEIRPHSLLFHSFASYGLRLASVETFLHLSPKSLRGGHCLRFSSRLILPYVMLTVRYLLLCVFNNNEKSVGGK